MKGVKRAAGGTRIGRRGTGEQKRREEREGEGRRKDERRKGEGVARKDEEYRISK